MSGRPIVEGAPGLTWRRYESGWEGLWRARADLIERGFPIKNKRVWFGEVPTERDKAHIADQCQSLQNEMLVWSRGSVPKVVSYDGTLGSLIKCYRNDPDSSWHKKRFHVHKNHDSTLSRIVEKHGEQSLARVNEEDFGINARRLLAWHKEWSDDGAKIPMGSAFVGMLRTLFSFGFTILEDPECERLCNVMHKMRFPAGKPRQSFLTAAHVAGIREHSHACGYHSIALAQSFQFELILRQKDVLGEWVPVEEPGISDVTSKHLGKWLRGIRWSEIDDDFILKHVTSKKQKVIEVDLKLSPVIMEELRFQIDFYGKKPASGPLVIAEATGRPWSSSEFRRKWRMMADMAGVPKTVKNMDSRSGGISEADQANVDREYVRKAATHSQISQTQDYTRDVRNSADNVLIGRHAHRKKSAGTDDAQ